MGAIENHVLAALFFLGGLACFANNELDGASACFTTGSLIMIVDSVSELRQAWKEWRDFRGKK